MAMSKAAGTPPDAMLDSPWSWIREGLPPAEKRQCQRSLVRAIMTGEAKQLCREAFLEYNQTKEDLINAGVWSQVQAFQQETLNMAAEHSKRARDNVGSPRSFTEANMDEDFLVLIEATDGLRHAPGQPSTAMTTRAIPPLPSTSPSTRVSSSSVPYLSDGQGIYSSENVWKDVKLPADVPNWEMWGRTLICFGKYNGQGVTYLNMATSEDQGHKDYRKWVVGRVESSTGQCHDLGLYLKQFDKIRAPQSVIPGTTQTRTYAN